MQTRFTTLLLAALLTVSWQAQMPSSRSPKQPAASHSGNIKAPSVYLDQLRASLQQQTAFATTRHNDASLWAEVRQTIDASLNHEWKSGRLIGNKPAEAYQVRCDRTTMTQQDVDAGRLIALADVATVKPGDFAVLKITQTTPGKNPAPPQRPRR